MNNQLYKTFVKAFQYIYRKALNFNDYRFNPTKLQEKQICNFIEFLSTKVDINSVGLNWVYDFILYGIKEKVEQRRFYKNIIPVNWIIGKKAYELFERKNKEWAFFNKKFANEKGIRFSDLEEQMNLDCSDYYESIRKENYKKDVPISYCYQVTPYNRKSKFCLQCIDKKMCIKINS